jgi:endonuclease/exonuclease/phosphatase (EEP) superfamily protein YafD
MKVNLKGRRQILLVPMDVYGMMTLIILLPQVIVGERWNLVGIFNVFSQMLWLPAVFLLPLALLLRSRRTAYLLLPAALCFIVTYGDHFLPHASFVPADDHTTFSFMTYNVFDDGRDPATTIALIEDANADVVAVQELNAMTAEAFDEHLATLYPYRAFHTDQGSYRGNGVMSKYPITADRYWHYDWMPFWLGHQRVELEIQGQVVTLYNLHTVHPAMGPWRETLLSPSPRNQEIATILEEAQAEEGLLLMAGDFNMPELSADYGRIVHDYGFVDAYRARAWGFGHTFTHGIVPFLRLDYIFLRKGIDVSEIKVWPKGAGSDHRPVWAVLALDNPS